MCDLVESFLAGEHLELTRGTHPADTPGVLRCAHRILPGKDTSVGYTRLGPHAVGSTVSTYQRLPILVTVTNHGSVLLA